MGYVYIGENEKEVTKPENEYDSYMKNIENCVLKLIEEGVNRPYKIVQLTQNKVPSSESEIRRIISRIIKYGQFELIDSRLEKKK
ncbi:MAG: hypothetical protein ACRENZ_01845 [Thermodesulfobacteriota bacterium]|jgi:hypothetical protein